MTTFISVRDEANKEEMLRRAVGEPHHKMRWTVAPAELGSIPRSPFVYWISGNVRRLFRLLPPLRSNDVSISIGASTKDDFRFLRLRTEVPADSIQTDRATTKTSTVSWVAYSKGGSYSPFLVDLGLVVDWAGDGRELKAYISDYRGSRGWGYQWSAGLNGHSDYFCPGITFPRRPHLRGSFQLLPPGCIFGADGPLIQASDLLSLSAALNSDAFTSILHLLMARGTSGGQTLKYEVGYLATVPLPDSLRMDEDLALLARKGWELQVEMSISDETSPYFLGPALSLTTDPNGGLASVQRWVNHVRGLQSELRKVLNESSNRCFAELGLDATDQEALTASLVSPEHMMADPTDEHAALFAQLFSWAVGVAFGRFDVSAPKQRQEWLRSIDPLAMLPAAPPATRTGLSASVASQSGTEGIVSLVDDPGHAEDIRGLVEGLVQASGRGTNVWDDVVSFLGGRNRNMRSWFAKDFFAYHIKQYSKSRRKAPIYWQLSTPSASYSVWCYYHRLTRDTFFRVANDYVTPKVDHEERKLNTLRQEAGPDPSSKQRKEIDAQETFVAELRAFLTEVKRIAPLWNPNLNDGVIINFAPLWRLVPQHKAWQKECKKVWDKLVKGDYDWAHLAMHLWPERVVPKCQDDRSLAIAHGLEDDFWYEDDEGKKTVWKKRQVSAERVAELVAERSSSAVKAALKELLEAPTPAGKSGTRRKRS